MSNDLSSSSSDSSRAATASAITAGRIAAQCTRLQSQLSAEADDLRRWHGTVPTRSVIDDGALKLARLMSNVNELLGHLAGEGGGELERDEH